MQIVNLGCFPHGADFWRGVNKLFNCYFQILCLFFFSFLLTLLGTISVQEFINDCWTMIDNRRNFTMYHVTIQISHQRRGCDKIVEDDEVGEER